MAIIDKIKAKARADVKRIVLPEGEEPRTIRAAAKILEDGLANLTMLGNPEKIKAWLMKPASASALPTSSIPPLPKRPPNTPPRCTKSARPRA